ncbi:MAG TPA: amidohydrolase family protein [Ktedonobacterales bacterium]|nr:amidohydrolase family protein [Ktedonobacterales bacterium]
MTALALCRANQVFPVTAAPLADGAVVVERGRILAVGAAAALGERYPSARVVDLGARALLPAAVNAHTHLELSGLSGAIPAGTPFADWVMALVRARRHLTFADYARAAADGIARLRASGTVAVGEICTFGASARPLVESGLRGILYFELLGVDPAQAPALLERGQRQIAAWQAEFAGAPLRFGLSLHTPYTVSAELFRLASAWCAEEGVPLCIHAAESPAEIQWLRDATGPIADVLYAGADWPIDPARAPGCSPMRYLERLGALAARPLLAHGVQVEGDDLALLAAREATVVHCPRSNARLLCGRLPYAAYRAAGVRLALGTDSLASAPTLSLWDEAAAAHTAHTAAGEAPEPGELLRLATLDGARALGVENELGSLEAGKRAELACAALFPLPERERADPQQILRALVDGRLNVERLVV